MEGEENAGSYRSPISSSFSLHKKSEDKLHK
jgi:hypothetical protein